MARIHIDDIDPKQQLSEEELGRVTGGGIVIKESSHLAGDIETLNLKFTLFKPDGKPVR